MTPETYTKTADKIFIPSLKWQLISALEAHYPEDRSFRGKSKRQLYAIYLNTRKEK